jgi:Putative transposase, YhgA-like/Domain of unknown function (DUF4351)
VRELLEVFAPPGIAELLGYETLRKESGKYITPAMKKREQDVVWSIELNRQKIYLYLLFEFQSSIDKGMPVRMMQYVAAVYDHLVRSKAINLSDGLPPVLPIVIYNGSTRWKQSTEIFDLIQSHPGELTEFQPRLKFWLLDECSYSAEYLEGLQRIMAAIFRMEHADDTEDVKRAFRYMNLMIAKSPYKKSLGKAVMRWALYRLNSKLPELPETNIDEVLKGTEMLEANLDRIRANAVAEGVLIGKLEGKLEGESTLLECQIVKRFGTISEEIRSRLKLATTDKLETWAERILDARTLAEVFIEH